MVKIKETLKCQHCDKLFTHIRVNDYQRLFCSRECSCLSNHTRNRKKRIKKKCIYCNCNFESIKNSEKKFCSVKCACKYNNKIRVFSTQRNKKISERLKGRIFSKEHKQKISNSKKGSIPWNKGIPRKEETKKKLSIASTKQMKTQNIYCRGKRGYVNGKCLKSSYEICYALLLNDKDIKWKYEEISFKLSNGQTYTPDFMISEFEFHEVKGWITEKAKLKIELFKKEYPQYKLRVVDYDYLSVYLDKYKTKIEEITI